LIWELNRLGHLITLGRAFALTKDEDFSKEFFLELTSWQAQNPVGRGVNWSCAMEVALRAMNLLGAFALFVQSSGLKEGELRQLLQIFDQHGAHIKRNLEFSYFGTSNHYLSDVVGLLWLGVMLPELEAAKEWRDWAFREMLREMDTQVLPDGGHYECATGYHRFVLELFLYSFLLCRLNAIEIEEKYWRKLHGMLAYLRAYLRPDGRAPLIGDSDSGRVLPITYRAGDEHAYLLPIGALVFNEPDLKLPGAAQELPGLRTPDAPLLEELIWIFGEPGVAKYQVLKQGAVRGPSGFPNVGTYVLGDDDVYLLLNASEVGMNGRGSHRHNDALSVEVSAYGSAFVVDPGTYLYTADLHQRHLFRSTAAHSTVQIDDYEQRTIREAEPFVISDKGKTVVLSFSTTEEKCEVVGQFYYDTLPAYHRRTVTFERRDRQWVIWDEVGCSGKHTVHFRFHFGPNVEVAITPDGVVEARDVLNSARLSIVMEGLESQPALESRFSSRDYGRKEQSTAVCWSEAVMGSTATKVVRAKFTLRPVSHESSAA
jgi:hypothetical protein